MVRPQVLLTVLLVAFSMVMFVAAASAQTQEYHLEHEWAKIWINQDGTIDLLYDINLTLDSGSNINKIYVGQPNGDFHTGTAKDQYGQVLTTSDASSGSDYKVQVNLRSPLTAGHSIRFNLTTNVANMIYNDTKMNPGNIGMEFIPCWWQYATVARLNVSIVLPSGVTIDKARTPVNWNGTVNEPDGRLSLYWERSSLTLDQRYTFGVSFPSEYLPSYKPPAPSSDGQLPPWVPPAIAPTTFFPAAAIFFVVLFIIIGVVVTVARKLPYSAPVMSMETLGIRRGLTAVEASYLLDVKPPMIVTEILYSLLQKRVVWVESASPSLKLKITQPIQDKTGTGTSETQPRYYEIDFVKAIKLDGTLDERKLAQTYMFLRDTVEEKMRGYCRRDTVDYYKKIVDKAWQQVEYAGTPELASNAYDEQLLWLFLDPNYKERTQVAFRTRVFEPNPLWWWYWYGYQHYFPNPTYHPTIGTPIQRQTTPAQQGATPTPIIAQVPTTPAQSPTPQAKPPSVPGSDFANNIATSLERTSNNIVGSLEKFAASIVPVQAPAAKASHEPAHHASSCVCACAACACACACVSCACACAGGGVG